MSIPPTVKQVESFDVKGFSVRTQNTDEFNEKTAKLPSLWQQFHSSGLATEDTIYGVYSNYDSDANGFYTVTAGVESPQAHDGLTSATIQAGQYLVFEGKGPMPATVVDTWKRVWDFFGTKSDYRRNFTSDFEAYKSADEVAIYIGLE